MIKKLRRWIKRLLKRKRYKYLFLADIPDGASPGILYIINNYEFPWEFVMVCPCGCKKLLHMNLIKEYDPHWRFEVDKRNRISVYPSIHRIVGCKSHFFVRQGKIFWA